MINARRCKRPLGVNAPTAIKVCHEGGREGVKMALTQPLPGRRAQAFCADETVTGRQVLLSAWFDHPSAPSARQPHSNGNGRSINDRGGKERASSVAWYHWSYSLAFVGYAHRWSSSRCFTFTNMTSMASRLPPSR